MPVSGGTTTVTVYESLQLYQTKNPANWGNPANGRVRTANIDEFAVIDAAGYFADGAYEFQAVGYKANNDGSVTETGALAGCGDQSPNYNNDFALYFANPLTTDTSPQAVITSLVFTVNGTPTMLPTCGILTVPAGAQLGVAINFTASDAEGFLDSYDLTLQWGSNLPTTITGMGVLTTSTPGVQVGPTYAQAITQGAARPIWSGGQYMLTIADAASLFPQSCAYELQLNVYKRNIVNCDQDDPYQASGYLFVHDVVPVTRAGLWTGWSEPCSVSHRASA